MLSMFRKCRRHAEHQYSARSSGSMHEDLPLSINVPYAQHTRSVEMISSALTLFMLSIPRSVMRYAEHQYFGCLVCFVGAVC